MDKYQETINTWNKVAKLYQDTFFDIDLYDDTYDAFCELLPDAGSKILDLGCGPGNITRYFLHKRPDYKITGIDAASQMLELAKKNNPAAEFQLMDVRDLHKLNKSFNGIIAGFCLPYLSAEDRNQLWKNCARLLEAPGIFYLSFVEGAPEDSGFQTGIGGDRVFFYYHDLSGINEELKNFGFELLNIVHKSYRRPGKPEEIHTILLAERAEISENIQ